MAEMRQAHSSVGRFIFRKVVVRCPGVTETGVGAGPVEGDAADGGRGRLWAVWLWVARFARSGFVFSTSTPTATLEKDCVLFHEPLGKDCVFSTPPTAISVAAG